MIRDLTDALPVVLTIAGSDSGGGAGIQADLKVFADHGVFGTSVITCVTAQNPSGVSAVEAISSEVVTAQLEAVCTGFPVAAAKTGMLFSAGIIAAVSAFLRGRSLPGLVVDPVMVATSGAQLLRNDAMETLCVELLPLARVLTPNLPEAELLAGMAIESRDRLGEAALAISERFGVACVVKGGHLLGGTGGAGAVITDVLCRDGALHWFEGPAVSARETHGTGCTFSAALASRLALGAELSEAVADAKKYVAEALSRAVPVGEHAPLGWGHGRSSY